MTGRGEITRDIPNISEHTCRSTWCIPDGLDPGHCLGDIGVVPATVEPGIMRGDIIEIPYAWVDVERRINVNTDPRDPELDTHVVLAIGERGHQDDRRGAAPCLVPDAGR